MRARALERALWSASMALAAWVIATSRHVPDGPVVGTAGIGARPTLASSDAVAAIDSAAAIVAANDPFRPDHLPSPLANVNGPSAIPTSTPASPRPTLVLQGVIGRMGQWDAVVIGVPGREGSVVIRSGDTLAGLHVRRIREDTVIISSSDTTWRLTLKESWR